MRGKPHSPIRTVPRRVFAGLIVLLSATFHAALGQGSLPQPTNRSASFRAAAVRERLSSTINSIPHPSTSAGVCIIDLNSGETVFDYNGDVAMIPASVMKLFVMVTSLTSLGTDFVFETPVGIIANDLVVIGSGDPGFGDPKIHAARNQSLTADFDRWAARLEERGIDHISGDMVIDESVFDNEWVHPTWERDDLDKWYGAPISGLNINDNCVDMTLVLTSEGSIRVDVQPVNDVLRIINHARVGPGRPTLHHPLDSLDYKISGATKKRWRFPPVSVSDPGLVFAGALRTVLRQHGIEIAGPTVRKRIRTEQGSYPEAFQIVASRKTALSEILQRIGHDSQNFFAECLLKRLGYETERQANVDRPQGTWSSGTHAEISLAQRIGMDTSKLHIADGSGLSRENRCTVRQLVDLLSWAQRQQEVWMLYDSLSPSGEPGSLKRRLRDLPRRVFAKTGTMTGVTALAGYVLAYDGSQYAFALMFNGYPGPSTPYRRIQDQVCRILAGDPEASP